MTNISPFLRCPLSDIVSGLTTHQLLGRCQRQEAVYMDCLEAYGLERGKIKCTHLFDDYHECHTLNKQFKRFMIMRQERDKQISEGKLTGDKKYVNPRVDSY